MLLRYFSLLMIIGVGSPLMADSVEIELGMGASYYDPGLSRVLIEDKALVESLTPLSFSFPGNAKTRTDTALFGFGQLDLYSNDFLVSIFFRGHYPTAHSTYLRPSLTSITRGSYEFEISDRIWGIGFNQVLYALNDRLRIVPGYGFIGYSQHLDMQGDVSFYSNSTTPATIGYMKEEAGNARSSAASVFFGLGFEYDWSETVRLKAQIRYMPAAHGSYDVTTTSYSRQISPTSGGRTLTTIGTQFQDGSARHALVTADFKIQYALNDYVQLNTGLRYERISSYYKEKPGYGYFVTHLQDSTGISQGAIVNFDAEYLSDPSIYRPLVRHNGSLYFSVTLRTGRDNI